MNEKKNYMTVREAMAEIKSRTGRSVSKYSFYSWLKKGKIESKRLADTILIAVTDLDIFLADFIVAKQHLVDEKEVQ